MTTTRVVPLVPAPRTSAEVAPPVAAPEREGTSRTPRPASQYWDVTEARWLSAR